MRRGKAVVMDIEKALHLRRDVERLGIAPLTSMYWYSETAKPTAVDWRPEIHDSAGLALWTGAGERICRPLNNPPRIMASSFADERPRGFGLMQRDRAFDHYLDGVYYDRRPSLWVEPLSDWGRGAVQLIELPTDDEIHDNVVAAWVPAEPARALPWAAGGRGAGAPVDAPARRQDQQPRGGRWGAGGATGGGRFPRSPPRRPGGRDGPPPPGARPRRRDPPRQRRPGRHRSPE